MKVNPNKIAFLISLLIFMTALLARWYVFADASPHGRYYIASIVGISGWMAVITLLRLLQKRKDDAVPGRSANDKKVRQRRENYRIPFDRSNRATFIERSENQRLAPTFTCAVINVSESGVGLDCTGVYRKGQTVLGEIIFDSGKTAPINGAVIREESGGTFISLHRTISASLLMEEQREQIQSRKAKGPLPKVETTALDGGGKTLPSHRSKGVCRVKRP